MDDIDKKILMILREDSRTENKEIGEAVHLTGQGVGYRISKLKREEKIKRFTIDLDEEIDLYETLRLFLKIGKTEREDFLKLVNGTKEIVEIHEFENNHFYLVVECISKASLLRITESLRNISKEFKLGIV